MAAVGATVGGIAELYSRRIDDNLSVPVAAAVGALAVMGWG
jgi:dolichol kinase